MAVLACTLGAELARADIYTWVDSSGAINVSNLPPPEGVRATHFTYASAPATTAREEAAREAEVQALAQRVGQLENELELAKRQGPPPREYRAIAAPPSAQYSVDSAPAPASYAAYAAPPTTSACDPTWFDCGFGWIPSIYPASVFVLRAPNFRRVYPVRGGHHLVSRQPTRMPGFRGR